jgi:hypothetical protein
MLIVWVLAACGPKHVQTTAIFSEQLSAAALTAQQTVTDLHAMGGMTDVSYQNWQAGFLKLGLGIKALNQALRDSNDKAVLEQVGVMVTLVTDLVNLEIPKLKEPDRVLVLLVLSSVKSTLLVISATWGGA